jgi:sortase A
VARIDMVRQQVSTNVLSGSSGEALSFGPALLNETARPGERGTAVIAGHRHTHFNILKDVVAGDLVTVTRDDGVPVIYRVTDTAIVDWNKSGIDPHANGFNLVLSTCHPFGAITHGPQRLLVKAEFSHSDVCQANAGPPFRN